MLSCSKIRGTPKRQKSSSGRRFVKDVGSWAGVCANTRDRGNLSPIEKGRWSIRRKSSCFHTGICSGSRAFRPRHRNSSRSRRDGDRSIAPGRKKALDLTREDSHQPLFRDLDPHAIVLRACRQTSRRRRHEHVRGDVERQEGRTLIDTAVTLNAMRPDIIVVRHATPAPCICWRERSIARSSTPAMALMNIQPRRFSMRSRSGATRAVSKVFRSRSAAISSIRASRVPISCCSRHSARGCAWLDHRPCCLRASIAWVSRFFRDMRAGSKVPTS